MFLYESESWNITRYKLIDKRNNEFIGEGLRMFCLNADIREHRMNLLHTLTEWKRLYYCTTGTRIPGRPDERWRDKFHLDELEVGTL